MTAFSHTVSSAQSWMEVLVDCPGATGLYTYGVPEHLTVQPGNIVSVAFGSQQVGAIAIQARKDLPEALPIKSIKTIESVINTSFFSKAYWQLLNRVARYYQTPFIRVIRSALPPGLLSRSQKRVRLVSQHSQQLIQTTESIDGASNIVGNFKAMSKPSAQMLAVLKRSPQGDYSWKYIRQQLKKAHKPQEISGALSELIVSGKVESYLAPPRSPQVQKRQAVVLIRAFADQILGDADLSARQQEIVVALARQGGELWLSDALQLLQTTSKTLKAIADKGYLVIEPRELLRSGSHSSAMPDRPKALTDDQAKALGVLHQMRGYSEALLHGVTGSGKTEVYLQAIAPIIKSGRSALVLVPEIGLTPQLTDRFRSRFGEKVCVYHSSLSEGERYDTWRQMLTGTAQIIIGTRSAVFAPLPNLGIIILDEEHDGSFKQDQPMPCYHARQVARWRAELERCPLVLGSATPAVETWVRFKENMNDVKIHYLALPQRVHSRPLPPIEVVDMRKELHEGNRTIFSRPLQKALEELVEKGNQGILFIHRRGHSSFVSCRSCGHVMECPNCDVSLSFHQTHKDATARLRCHYCGFGQPHPAECPECASPYLKNFGSGTQRVVNDLAKYLPQARCIRFDSDTTRNKGAHRALLTRFAQGEADLLVGTQMLTKGIDLPQVTLVGVIAADGLLFMPDFRASERAFQTMTQVAGRAGRGEQPGRVIVQTYSPDHVAIEALTQKKADSQSPAPIGEPIDSQVAYANFLEKELSDRADLTYPPYGQLVLLRISGLDERITERSAHRISKRLGDRLSKSIGQSIDRNLSEPLYDILGPVPAPIFRVASRYRWHILLKLPLRSQLPQLTDLQRQVSKGVSLSIDVDPMNLS